MVVLPTFQGGDCAPEAWRCSTFCWSEEQPGLDTGLSVTQRGLSPCCWCWRCPVCPWKRGASALSASPALSVGHRTLGMWPPGGGSLRALRELRSFPRCVPQKHFPSQPLKMHPDFAWPPWGQNHPDPVEKHCSEMTKLLLVVPLVKMVCFSMYNFHTCWSSVMF